jgi:hypothetical protein
MKSIRNLLLTGLTLAGFCASSSAWAQTTPTPPTTPPTATTPPVVVVPHGDKDLYQDLRGAPKAIQTLIVGFDKTRDKFLAAQDLLLIKLSHATTAAEREQIRDRLQENRQDFLAALKAYREKIEDDLAALKGKVSHEEFLRIIDAAHDAATEGGIGHHRGH